MPASGQDLLRGALTMLLARRKHLGRVRRDPPADRVEVLREPAAQWRQRVFDARRHLPVVTPRDEAVLLQCAERQGEHALADAAHAAPQLGVAVGALGVGCGPSEAT